MTFHRIKVYQTGDDATVAFITDEDFMSDYDGIVWTDYFVRHAHLHRFDGYWYEYNPRQGEWTQLFGYYGGVGPAMMMDRLPGIHVDTFEELPEETK